MKKYILLLALVLTLGNFHVQAQNAAYKNGISFKALFLDYQSQNGGSFSDFKSYHSGFEIGYHHRLANNLNVNIPFKLGVAKSHVEQEGAWLHKTVMGADLQLEYQFYNPARNITPYLMIGIGGVTEQEGETNFQAPVGAGLLINIADNAFFNWESEYRTAFADDRNNLHHSIGFKYLFGKKKTMDKKMDEEEEKEEEMLKPNSLDSDGDGLIDEADLCPQAAGPKELNGCPDSDGDGIADYADLCPKVAGSTEFKGCPDSDGDGLSDNDDDCPNLAGPVTNKGCPDNDNDNDGIANNEDKCPDAPGPISTGGCPEIDSDGDGVPDDRDKCPNEAGPNISNGCPDTDGDGVPNFEDRCPNAAGLQVYSGCPDSDGDGIDDSRDRCPNSAGTVSAGGCPGLSSEDQRVLDLAVRAVQFDSGRSTLKTNSYSILNQIADIMKKYPDYKMTVTGHTDNTGSPASNQVLSERRAAACKEYLMTRGIGGDRLTSLGKGQTSPIAENSSLRGRELNRRVEFNLQPR